MGESKSMSIQKLDDGKLLELLTLEELNNLKKSKPNTKLINIFGDETLAKNANDDTRWGLVAYGFIKKTSKKLEEEDYFIIDDKRV